MVLIEVSREFLFRVLNREGDPVWYGRGGAWRGTYVCYGDGSWGGRTGRLQRVISGNGFLML